MTIRRIPHPRNHGEPLTLAWVESNCEKTVPTFDALASLVVGPCWLWLGAVNSSGYGAIGCDGDTVAAHRVSYKLVHGEFPPEHSDHLCRNRRCVNPEHIEPVSAAENVKRGLRTRHLRTGQCADCGSTEGRVKRTRNGQQWLCTPCAAGKDKARFQAKYATPEGKAETRARNQAKRLTGSTVSWRDYLTDEERALFK